MDDRQPDVHRSPAMGNGPQDVNQGGVDRRSWVNTIFGAGLLGSILSFLYPVVRFIFPPNIPDNSANQVTVSDIAALKPNSGEIFKFGNEPGILIHTPNGDWKAFSAVCTHLSCTVQYRPDLQEIWCACHGGTYNLNGQVVSGPPPRPLPEYTVHVVNGEAVVSRNA
jgi:cytochrome b6-f complex iron-sulfur subunit